MFILNLKSVIFIIAQSASVIYTYRLVKIECHMTKIHYLIQLKINCNGSMFIKKNKLHRLLESINRFS